MRHRWGVAVFWLASGVAFTPPQIVEAADTVLLKIATQGHPHIQAFEDGRVTISGCSVQWSTHPLKALQQDLTGDHRYDVLEIELLPYMRLKAAGQLADYTLIPVFLSRAFQLRNIYIRSDRSIQKPKDLRGKKIGVSGYAGVTPMWVRGLLQSSWTVKPEEMTWVDTEAPGASPRSLSQLLDAGEVDAIFSDVPPKSFGEGNSKVVRLFPDFKTIEQMYFQKNRVFPIVTALAVRKELADNNAWLPEALFIAFSKAKQKAQADGALPLPWEGVDVQEVYATMGEKYWSYGVKGNPKSLGTLFDYASAQKLLDKPLTPQDLFTPSTLMLLEP